METHPCEAVGCQEPVARDRFMCIRHWRMVPKPLRDEVWGLFVAYERALRQKMPKAALSRARLLREVQARAIEAVREKELRKQAAQGSGQAPLAF